MRTASAIPWAGHLHLTIKRQRENTRLAHQLAQFAREADQPLPTAGATAPGDPQKLRGIPAVGGISGTIRGTQPEHALIAKEARGLLNLIRDIDGTSPGTQPEEALLAACA